MTANDFNSICAQHGVDPRVAFENKRVRDLIKRDKGKGSVANQLHLNSILSTEF